MSDKSPAKKLQTRQQLSEKSVCTESIKNHSDHVSSNSLKNNKGFKNLCFGSLISMLGDQLTLITLPWLAFYLSPEPWVLGSVLATLALPMTIFLLIGGAIVDSYSPKNVLLYSKYANAFLMSILVLLLITQQLNLPLLYLIVFLIGTSSAFAIPAGTSLLPAVVNSEQLPAANSIGMTLRSLATLVGPLLAAILLGIEATKGNSQVGQISHYNLALVFALDAFSFIFSALVLVNIKITKVASQSNKKALKQNVFDGIHYFWQQRDLRLLILYMALVTSFLGGLMQVGLPLLVKNQWQESAGTFAYMMALFAFGNIAGMMFAGKYARQWRVAIGTNILLADIFVGTLLILISQVDTSDHGWPILMSMGLISGYVQVIFISWVQQQAKREMLGRLMSIVMFSLVGLLPLSATITGLLLQSTSTSNIFLFSGFCLFCLALLALFFSRLSKVGKLDSIEDDLEQTDLNDAGMKNSSLNQAS